MLPAEAQLVLVLLVFACFVSCQTCTVCLTNSRRTAGILTAEQTSFKCISYALSRYSDARCHSFCNCCKVVPFRLKIHPKTCPA